MQTFDLFVDQGEAIVDGKIFGDIVNDEVKSTLEDPGWSEKARPSLNSIVEDFCFRTHEKAWISSNLAEMGITHLRLDDGVYEI